MTKIALNVLRDRPEIFKSFQGEGRNAGQECVFIRLKGCNLYCSWCDTKDSWDATNPLNEGTVRLGIPELVSRIDSLKCKHLVITGGEPLLQQPALRVLLDELKDFYVEIETNGTIMPSLNVAQWNVSPKLYHSGVDQLHRSNPRVMQAFREMDNADFKFVIGRPEHVSELVGLINHYRIPAERVFLMPLGQTRVQLAENEDFVKKFCSVYGFNFSDRLHVKKYGNRRGV